MFHRGKHRQTPVAPSRVRSCVVVLVATVVIWTDFFLAAVHG